MKKIYILEDLDCANCAAKIEAEVGKLEGVSKSTVSLLTQKLTVEIEEEKGQSITSDIKRIVKKWEPDVSVIEK